MSRYDAASGSPVSARTVRRLRRPDHLPPTAGDVPTGTVPITIPVGPGGGDRSIAAMVLRGGAAFGLAVFAYARGRGHALVVCRWRSGSRLSGTVLIRCGFRVSGPGPRSPQDAGQYDGIEVSTDDRYGSVRWRRASCVSHTCRRWCPVAWYSRSCWRSTCFEQ